MAKFRCIECGRIVSNRAKGHSTTPFGMIHQGCYTEEVYAKHERAHGGEDPEFLAALDEGSVVVRRVSLDELYGRQS